MDSGTMGYISKIANEEELLHCLDSVKRGHHYLEENKKEIQIKLVDLLEGFTKQEKVIFEALLQGKTNEQIGEELFISVKTVNNYTCRIYKKVDVKDRFELIKKYGQ